MNQTMIDEMKRYLAFNRDNNISDICSPLYSFGIKGFFYVKLYPNGTFVDLSTNLDLAEFYLRKFYACEYSPCDMKDNYLPIGINLWELNKSNKIWADCREVFNVGNGFSMSLSGNIGFTEIFFFYSDADNYKINELYLNHLDIFKNFSFYFKEKAKKLIVDAEKYKLTMPNVYRNNCIKKDNSENFPCEAKEFYTSINLNRFALTNDEYLTFREAECLFWCANGKTTREIAIILKISFRTVERHLENIKEKSQCFNKAALINVAIESGLFDFFKNKSMAICNDG